MSKELRAVTIGLGMQAVHSGGQWENLSLS